MITEQNIYIYYLCTDIEKTYTWKVINFFSKGDSFWQYECMSFGYCNNQKMSLLRLGTEIGVINPINVYCV